MEEKEKFKSLFYLIFMDMDVEFLQNIMYGRLLNIISNFHTINKNTNQVHVTTNFGKEMIKKYLYNCYRNQYKKDNNLTFLSWKQNNGEIINFIKESQLDFQLGNVLINLMFQLCLVDVFVKKNFYNEKVSILIPGSKIENLIPNSESSRPILILPKNLPMIVKPKLYQWDISEYKQVGGYLLNGEEYINEIILDNWELSSSPSFLPKNDICDMINNMNSVAFKINETVLDFIVTNNHKYNFFSEQNYIHPLSLETKLTFAQEKELESFYSRRYLEQNILGLATLFKEVPSFYLPVRLDYRGRLYCMVDYLNYQGIELAKCLLEFSIGEKIYLTHEHAIKYLKIFGANCFGNKIEKKSFKDRIAWIDENLQDIINFENGVLLNKAENKLIFLSFCFEFKKYIQAINNKDTFFISHLPIQLDASCNGFQHLTLLIDDLALSKELNLSESYCTDVPKDFYSFVGLKIKDYFYSQLENNKGLSTEDKLSYQKLANLNLHRTLIKKAVMTIPYNASVQSIVNYIKEGFEKKINPENELSSSLRSGVLSEENKAEAEAEAEKMIPKNNYYIYILKKDPSIVFLESDFQNLRKALNIVLFVNYPKLTLLLDYLKKIAIISNSLSIPIPWILASGLVVKQQFYAKKNLKVKPFYYTNNLLNLSVTIKNKFNEQKQKIALMPNLVHSLDAASLCVVMTKYFKEIDNKNLYSIHDCFAVPCNKVNLITELLKVAYCIIYTKKKYLIEFNNNFIDSIKIHYGENNVYINKEKEKLIVITESPQGSLYEERVKISFKFPSIDSIIDSKISNIDVSKSCYLAH
uniref:DNA-directed RNA polymerase n=1 Tax=Termitomyces sp. DKA64 TaxID=2811476 RepID=A0A8F1ACX4_9AGAR|nr:RNA polymerase [Termitomyces sp. DKA64]